MQYAQPITIALALIIAAAPACAQEARRQLEAHSHGSGSLTVAIENNRLQMELEVPASDIVGFEHAPSTAAQKKAIADAKARLAKPGELFKLSPDAGCKAVSASVDLVGAAGGTGKVPDEHGHSHGKSAKAEAKTGTKAPSQPAEAAANHSEFRVTYALDCTNAGKLRSIGFEYFKAFKAAEKLDVTVIGPKGQSRSVVPRSKPVLDLAGTT